MGRSVLFHAVSSKSRRIKSWTLPPEALPHQTLFSSMRIRALLFSD
jgi:hypothetical protein